MPQSFQNKKALRFIITLGTGKFGSSNNNQITLQGFRATVDIDKAGGTQMGTLKAQIFGVSQSDMNSVTTLQWKPKSFIPNTVQVYAIDGAQETLVFTGNIVNAWGNYQNMPDVFLMIQAQAAYFNQLAPVAPTSFNGSVDVATAMSGLASQMGLTFENNGVSTQLQNQYLPNTALEQAKTLANAAGCWMYVDGGVLAITPAYQPRSKPVPLLSADSGLVSYPTFDGVGVNFEAYFNPSVIFGGSIQIDSSIPQAAGTWIVTSLSHLLDSEKPGGRWFSRIRGNATGLAVTS
jgi:hypothetical protein